MADERLSEILRIVEEALDRDSAERAAYLDAECGADAELRREVGSLLAEQAAGSRGPLEMPPWADPGPALVVGQRLGPYEVTGTLGAGGMGEVYEALDTRLNRTVAVKVLSGFGAVDPDVRDRFAREAQAVAALGHPHICPLFDVGRSVPTAPAGMTEGGKAESGAGAAVDYLVMEHLEGQTLAERLRKPTGLPLDDALSIGAQIADALAAAHKQGIVHRDLKPANVMLTKTGAERPGESNVKLLDFGLAKLRRRSAEADATRAGALAHKPLTARGAVMGTVPYMAPEQLEGHDADARTDVFAFGCVLYEMLTGCRAFTGDSDAGVIASIMASEPPPVSAIQPTSPPALDRVVRRCLAKDPDARWQSASDLADELRWLREPHVAGRDATVAAAAPGRPLRRRLLAVFAMLGLLAVGAAASALYLGAGKQVAPASPPSFARLTFRRGWISAARFAPDGQTVVFSAAWDGGPNEVFSLRLGRPESLRLGHSPAELLAVSSDGWLALNRDSRPGRSPVGWSGTLARVPLSGGSPRDIAERVTFADWSPDGKDLAFVTATETLDRLEYPAGTVLAAGGAMACLRISPADATVAFIDAPASKYEGAVAVVDRQGHKTRLTGNWPGGVTGLAWSPKGDEVWFTASASGNRQELRAVTLDGRQRMILRESGPLRLLDIAMDGRVLVARDESRVRSFFHGTNDTADRELSWLDWSQADDLSADGRTVVINEFGEGAGADLSQVYLRDTAGKEPVYLGPGYGIFSPDETLVLATIITPPAIALYPTRPGQHQQTLHVEGINVDGVWGMLPDNRTLVLDGNEPSHDVRVWLMDRYGSKPRPITPEGVSVLRPKPVSPDGTFVMTVRRRKIAAYPTAGGEPWPVKGLVDGDRIAGWGPDGRWIFITAPGVRPNRLFRVDARTGARTLLREIVPIIEGGRLDSFWARTTPDGQSYVYNTAIKRSDLYLVEGLK